MNENKPPRVTKKRGLKSTAVIGICGVIAVGGVALSGAAGYAGTRLAMESSSPVSQVNASSVGSGNTIQVLDVSDVVATLRPSVVEIATEIQSSGNSMFGQYVAEGAGSGVILTQDGYIVTNNHVIEDATSIQVKTMDGQTYDATLVGTDPQTDIAVIKIDATDLTPASIGDSNAIDVGEAAIAIGNPLGSLGGTVTTGIISAVGREINIDNETMTLLQTDAAINAGNSGGGLFDVNGQLIGIVNAKTADTGIEGLGFAIPISDVTGVIDDLMEHGTVTTRPVLNVSLQNISNSSYYGQNRTTEPGVYIVQIVQGGTADNAGLQVGDRIISFDGQDISDASDVKNILKNHSIGDSVDMVIDRQGQQMTVTLNLQGSTTE